MDGFTSGSCFAAIRHPEPAVPKLNQVQSFNLEPRGTPREQKLELQERQRNREKSKNEKKNERKVSQGHKVKEEEEKDAESERQRQSTSTTRCARANDSGVYMPSFFWLRAWARGPSKVIEIQADNGDWYAPH